MQKLVLRSGCQIEVDEESASATVGIENDDGFRGQYRFTIVELRALVAFFERALADELEQKGDEA